MKKLYIFILLLIIPRVFFAQNEQWSDPVPITDSLTDNRNVTLSTFEGSYNLDDTLYACWEKSSDTTSTALYCRRLIPFGDPFVLLSMPNVHFKNPKIYRYNSGDIRFSVYFQTDMNGNWDIYYVDYLKNGTVSSLFPLRTTPQDETNFFAYTYQGNITDMVWEQDGRILYKGTLTDTVQIDKDDCHKPLIEGNYVFYTKNSGGSSIIYYDEKNDIGIWGPYVYVTDLPGQYEHLTIGNDTHSGSTFFSYNQMDLLFQQKPGIKWNLMDFDNSFVV